MLRYFKPFSTLPTPSDVGLAESAVKKANEAVQRELDRQKKEKSLPKKRKAYSLTRPARRYAAENGNAAALKKFRSDIADLGESTSRRGTWRS